MTDRDDRNHLAASKAAPAEVVSSTAEDGGTPVVTTSVAGEAGAIDEDSGTVLDRPGDATALVEALASWFDRVRVGDVEPALVRARVAHRDEDVWLDRLERIVGEVAAEIAR